MFNVATDSETVNAALLGVTASKKSTEHHFCAYLVMCQILTKNDKNYNVHFGKP